MKHCMRAIIGLCAVTVAALAVPCCRGASGEKSGEGKGKGGQGFGVRVVSVETVSRRDLLRTGTYRGELRAEKVVEVAPDVQGRIKKLYVDMGSRVEKGDLLVELDPLEMNQLVSEGKAGVEMAAASVKQAEVALEKAVSDLERKKPLAAKGLVTQAEIETLENAVQSAQSGLEVARAKKSQSAASLKNLNVNRKNLKVRAAFDGVIARRYLNEGAMASPATPVFQLHAEGKLYMRIAVPEKDVALVTEQMTGTIALDAMPGRTLMFSVALISPVIEQVTRTCTVDLLVTVGPDLVPGPKPGMTGVATMVLARLDAAVAIPRVALVDKDGKTLVFIMEKGKARMIEVEVAGEYGDHVVAGGVDEGAKVVVKGQVDLEDGVPVKVATLE